MSALPDRIEPGASPALADQWEADALVSIDSVLTPEDAQSVLRRVKAVEAAVRLSELGRERSARWAAIKLRAERRHGELLGSAQHGGDRSAKQLSAGKLTPADHMAQHKARLVASIPEEKFEEYLRAAESPTRAGLLASTADAPLLEPDDVQLSILKQVLAAEGEDVARERAAEMGVAYPDDLADGASKPKREKKRHLRVVEDPPPLNEGEFRVIVADPPWQYGNTSTRGAAEDHYPTMPLAALCELPVEDRSAPDAHLYLWVTNNFLREGFEVMDAWGFEYRTCLTWVKPQIGMGNYFRGATEHVLFGTRGKLAIEDRSLRNWFEAPRGRHSAKPDCFYDLVEKASPGPYLEMFSRRSRLGWSAWGNEALQDVEVSV